MIRTLLLSKKTLVLHKKHLGHQGAGKHTSTGRGLPIHHIAHQMKHLKIAGAILNPISSGLLVGSGTKRHQKPLSLDDFKKKPISKIF